MYVIVCLMQVLLPLPNHVEYISKKEVCLRLGISIKTLERHMGRGIIPYYKRGTSRRASVYFKWGEVVRAYEAFKVRETPDRKSISSSSHPEKRKGARFTISH